jgi:hypothetical protein
MEVRRRFARWKINVSAKMKLAGAEKFVNCHIEDISMRGVKISLPLKLPDDKFVKLTLALSDTFMLNIEAWVGWHKSANGVNTYGLYFTRIAESDKEKIFRYFNANKRDGLEKAWWHEDEEIGMEESSVDNRIFQRFAIKLPVRVLDLSSGKEGAAVTQDVSAKGIGITLDEELKPHTHVEIWLQVPDKGEPIYTRGEVVWSRPKKDSGFKAGINLEKADLMGLSRVLRS